MSDVGGQTKPPLEVLLGMQEEESESAGAPLQLEHITRTQAPTGAAVVPENGPLLELDSEGAPEVVIEREVAPDEEPGPPAGSSSRAHGDARDDTGRSQDDAERESS